MFKDHPIHGASSKGNLAEVARLVEEEPRLVNIGGHDFWTPLHCSAASGMADVVTYLLDHGANIDQGDHLGSTPLLCTCWHGHTRVVERLIERGADPTTGDDDDSSALMHVSGEGYVDLVRCFLKNPRSLATINHQNLDGQTALYEACFNGHGEVVRMLLQAGADPTLIDNQGQAATDMATSRGHRACIKLLQVSDKEGLAAVE